MDKTLEDARALMEAARLRRVVDRLRCLAAATAADLAAVSRPGAGTSAPFDDSGHKSVTFRGLTDSKSG